MHDAPPTSRRCSPTNAHFYVCGLKAMEEGVVLALRDVARHAGLDWDGAVAPR